MDILEEGQIVLIFTVKPIGKQTERKVLAKDDVTNSQADKERIGAAGEERKVRVK